MTKDEQGDDLISIDSLELGGVRLRHLKIGSLSFSVLGSGPGTHFASSAFADTPAMLIGADVLRHLRVFIAQKEQKVYFTLADAS